MHYTKSTSIPFSQSRIRTAIDWVPSISDGPVATSISSGGACGYPQKTFDSLRILKLTSFSYLLVLGVEILVLRALCLDFGLKVMIGKHCSCWDRCVASCASFFALNVEFQGRSLK